MARMGAVGVGWLVTVVIDQALGFVTSGLESTKEAAASTAPSVGDSVLAAAESLTTVQQGWPSATHLILASVIGLVAGASGGWLAATIDDDALASKTLAILLVFSALVSAGLASMAGYGTTATTWLVGGILQGVGSLIAGRVKFG